jgi:two-component system cell cycle sensor histidine kinase/response regulator CckA
MTKTPTSAATPRRILLVEDDRELREALIEVLESANHVVVGAGDGSEALAQMRASRPDVVVLDLMMPVMDGWQFRVEQKRDPSLAGIPIVAISASTSPMAAAVDADVYLRKPVDKKTLLGAIDDVLALRERLREPAMLAQSERMAALGTLAGGVAHEINNPLTYVLLHLTQAMRLLATISGGPNQATVEKLEMLVRGALEGGERIRAITSGIRAFTRIEDRTRAPVDVHGVVESAITLVPADLKRRAKLNKQFGVPPIVLANEGALAQVFLNLVTNAFQAIPDDGADSHEVTIRTGSDRAGRAFVEVTDDGEGVPEHLTGRIFEPFFSTRAVGQGMGLGLSMSHGIVASLGGDLVLQKREERGATFRVTLPAAYGSGTRLAERLNPSRRVMVIDDEFPIARAIRDALAGQHEVVIVDDSVKAIEMIESSKASFDVVLCDLNMSGLSGIDVYERLRATRPKLAERMVFMTSGIMGDRARAFLAEKPRRLLHKPVDFAEVRQLLSTPATPRRRSG